MANSLERPAQESEQAMYARRIQIVNYGPIDHLDFEFPFGAEGRPKPVVLVGENGSGKSILLSHIVNGLVAAKNVAYPGSREVPEGRVYKLRSPMYINTGNEYYFAHVDFAEGLFTSELQLRSPKGEYPLSPDGVLDSDARVLWDRMSPVDQSHLHSNLTAPLPMTGVEDAQKAKRMFETCCVLYFPADRFEHPAWLSSKNLAAEARYDDGVLRVSGETLRRVIASSALQQNQNWLFNLIYDSRVLDATTGTSRPISEHGNVGRLIPLVEVGYDRSATELYGMALTMVRHITGHNNAMFAIGNRRARVVGLNDGDGFLTPNIFQLSSGEVSLVNLFLSILRDYDACDVLFSQTADVRGIVIVDEIDLHLHVRHQYDVLPSLIALFPNVQFIVTTHSPLFVLGMSNVFGEDGFELRRLPDGERIGPEEFSEFGNAYQAFAETQNFEDDSGRKLLDTQKPVLYVEGATDVEYLCTAAKRLGHDPLLDRFDVSAVGGKGQLRTIWAALEKLEGHAAGTVAPRVVLLLHDPEYDGAPANSGNAFRRTMPKIGNRRIAKGIEHLFPNDTIERARDAGPAYIDIELEHPKTVRGVETVVEEQWTVNEDEKANLCQWLCENGTAEDFKDFARVFDILEEVLQSANHDDSMPH